jgi:Protein of unknown function (DUF1559)
MLRYSIIPLFVMLAGPARAADRDVEALVADIAPYLDEQALGVIHVDLSRLDIEEPLRQLQKMGAPAKDIEQARKQAGEFLEQVQGMGVKRGFAVISLAELPDQPPLIVLPLEKDAGGKALVTMLNLLSGKEYRFEQQGSVLVGGTPRTLKRLAGMKPVARPDLTRALNAIGDASISAVFLPTDTVRRAIEELVPALPREAGGGPATIVTRGLRWVAAGLAPRGMTVKLTVQASDEASAKALQGVVRNLFKFIGKEQEVREALPDLEKLTAGLLPKVEGDRLVLVVKQDLLVSTLAPAAQKTREAARQQVSVNNLKQIALAFHGYHDVHNHFAAAANYDKQDNPLLSWRVHLLPYLDEAKLYKEFRLDEPWDSDHNKKLIKRMPKVFASSPNLRLAEEGRTTYVVPTGPDTAFADKKGLRLADVTDGTSNTVLVVDVDDEQAVIWTKPEDWKVDKKAPARGLRQHEGKKFLMAFMDGSVRFLPVKIDAQTLLAIFSPSGGEVVNLP